nr:MAG TPA: hypothetical protein [Caudoviricetes sp.]
MENKFLIQKIKKLGFTSTEESIRYEAYSIFTSMILSRQIFSKNQEIKEFLDNFEIDIKDYLLRNRASMLSKALKEINKMDNSQLLEVKKVLISIYSEYLEDDDYEKPSGYVKNILDKYTRNKDNGQ